MPVTVRQADIDDLAAMQAIYAHHVTGSTASFEIEPPDLAEMQTRWAAREATGHPTLVAVVDGSGAGSSTGTSTSEGRREGNSRNGNLTFEPSRLLPGEQHQPVLLGYAHASTYKAREAYRYTVEDSIYVHPAALGLGVGRALLDALIDECRQAGFRQMMAVIGDSRNLASIRLHEQAGFERIGMARAIGYKFEQWLDVVYLQKSLTGEGTPPDR